MRALVIGGGVGGLMTALTLHEKNIEVELFEQSTSIRELGVGINILPHAVLKLAQFGLLNALDACAIRTGELIYKNSLGQEILRQSRGLAAGHEAPQFSIHRGKLQGVIHDAVVARLGADPIHTGHRMVRLSQDEESVSAVFLDRAQDKEVNWSGDILIGADGIHSTVRALHHPDQGPPLWNGVLMWRGATWSEPFLTGRSMIIAGGMAAKLVLYPIYNDPENHPGKVLTNWVVCAKLGEAGATLPLREDWAKPGSLDEVLPHARNFTIDEVRVEELIRATDEFFVYPMCDRNPLEHWTEGRVTLAGDAAHPMYPVGSNGASQAILDACALGDRLSPEPSADPRQALAAYEAERRPATSAIVKANRVGGPESVIDLVEARAPNGFDTIQDVASVDELRALVGDYQQMETETVGTVT